MHRSTQIRVGLVGCGRAGLRRAAAVGSFPGGELVFVCDSNAATLADSGLVPAVTVRGADPAELIGKHKPDAVIISTPPTTHERYVDLCTGLGVKRLLVEKPLAATFAGARRIVEMAASRGADVKVGSNLRRFGEIESLIRVMQSGRLGTPILAGFHIGHSGKGLQSWAKDVSLSGGGTLLDNGVHVVDLARYLGLLGDRYELQWAEIEWLSSSIDHTARFALMAHLDLPSGQTHLPLAFSTTWNRTDGFFMDLTIEGTEGTVVVKVGESSILRFTGKHAFSTRFHKNFNSWEADTHEFLKAALSSRPACPTASEGAQVLHVVDSVYAAARDPSR